MPTLWLDLRAGESVSIDKGRVTMTLESKTGKAARVKFVASESVPIAKVTQAPTTGAMNARRGLPAG